MKRTTTKELCRLLAATAIGVTTATAADKAGIINDDGDSPSMKRILPLNHECHSK